MINARFLFSAVLVAAPLLSQNARYPAGLQPGDEYRVLLVTDSVTNALSANIADYDALVEADVLAAPNLSQLNTRWRAVGSTPSVSAREHTGTSGGGGVPIYRVDGIRIADDYDALWSAASSPLLVAPKISASGVVLDGTIRAYTGSNADGTPAQQPLGNPGGNSLGGVPTQTGYAWQWASLIPNHLPNRLYGISDVIRVPQPQYPAELEPGDSFRVLCPTDSVRDASASSIAVYDNFVDFDARFGWLTGWFDTSWKALASTSAIIARTHTGTADPAGGVPIYRPDGVRVADGNGHLWFTATQSPLLAAPKITPDGAVVSQLVWTGSDSFGNVASAMGTGSGATVGNAASVNSLWAAVGSPAPLSQNRPLYAMSDVITIPEWTHPPELVPGDQYRVLVVTEGVIDATSSDIAVYDSFVQAEMASNYPAKSIDTTWKALVSTPTVEARPYVGGLGSGGVPFYGIDGVRIADNNGELWGGPFGAALQVAPNVTSRGALTPATEVWTGSLWSGFAYSPSAQMGSPGGTAAVGSPKVAGYNWFYTGNIDQTNQRPLYALSAVITVPFPSAQVVRAGTPPNPGAFQPGSTPPVIGGTWNPYIDHTTFATNAALDIAMFGVQPINVPVPGLGTALCGNLLASYLTAFPIQTFELDLPNDVSLLGAQMCVQGLSLDFNWQFHLANAIDIVVGTF